ncbi:hypothetical protein Lepto7375DRAFT_4996 [Leptolyngbya sp. PCC 7375]|nr:hypothetical protein Lepto7375DRAFT_4996 [Leptolyngbya sp. PCC 7375]
MKSPNVIYPIKKPIRSLSHWCIRLWDGISGNEYRRVRQLRTALAVSQQKEADLTQQLNQAQAQCLELQQALENKNQQVHELWEELDALIAENDTELQTLKRELANQTSALSNCHSNLVAVQRFQATEVQATAPVSNSQPDTTSETNLANWKIAFVGGHQATRRFVIDTLHTSHGLIHTPVEIPSHREVSTSQKQLKDKLADCDLVVSIVGYSNHSLTKSLTHLRDKGALKGSILIPNSRGATGVVRDILAFVAKQPDPIQEHTD